MSNLTVLPKAPRTLDSERACLSTDLGRFNICCENTNLSSFILASHKMKNNALKT